MLINLLSKAANGKIVLAFFLFTIFFTLYFFGNYAKELNQIAGQEVEMLDLKRTYTLEEVNTTFTNMKAEGRQLNRYITGVTDMIYPFVYGPFFILALAFFIKKLFYPTSKWLYLSLFPILIMVVDYGENFNTLELLDMYPDLTAAGVEKGSNLTHIKHILIDITLGLIILSGFGWIGKLLKARLS